MNEYLVKIINNCSDGLLDAIAEIATMTGENECLLTMDDLESRVDQVEGHHGRFLQSLKLGKYNAYHFV